MRIHRHAALSLLTVPLFAASLAAGARDTAGSPQALAGQLQQLVDRRDLDGIDALLPPSTYPLARRFLLTDIADECFAPAARCRVTAAKPAPDDFESSPDSEYRFTVPPTGKLVIKRAADDDSGRHQSEVTLPIARVAGRYRILAGELTAAAVARQKIVAQPREKIEQEVAAQLASVMYADLRSPGDEAESFFESTQADILARAERSATDAGAMTAYRTYVDARRRGDSGYLATHGTRTQRAFAAALARQPPRPSAAFDRKLDAAFAYAGPIQTLGGWRHGDYVAFAVHGMTGTGWPAGGIVVLRKTDSDWELASETVEFWPAEG